jgi:hypothetical protein
MSSYRAVIRGSVVVDVKGEGMHIVAFLRGVSGILVLCVSMEVSPEAMHRV